MKKYKLEKIKTLGGKTLRVADVDKPPENNLLPITEATLLEALKAFIYSLDRAAEIQRVPLVMADSIKIKEIYRRIGDSKDGILFLENEEYQWLLQKMEEFGTLIFGVLHASFVLEALMSFEK